MSCEEKAKKFDEVLDDINELTSSLYLAKELQNRMAEEYTTLQPEIDEMKKNYADSWLFNEILCGMLETGVQRIETLYTKLSKAITE